MVRSDRALGPDDRSARRGRFALRPHERARAADDPSQYVPGGGGTAINTLPFPGNNLTSDPVRYARTVAILEAEPTLGIGSPTLAG